MDRDRFAELVSLYFDDALDAEGVAELNGLLESQPELAARFVRLGRVHGGLRELEAAGAVPAARPRRWAAGVPAFLAAAAALLVAFLVVRPEEAPESVPSGELPRALFVVRDVPCGIGDRLVEDRLRTLGLRPVPVDDDEVSAEDIADADLIVISDSALSEKLTGKFAEAAVPILNFEPHLNGDLRIARQALPGEFPGKTYRFRLRIVDPAHPLAAGLSGDVKVYAQPATVNWSAVDDSAMLVARCDDNPEHAAIFAYEGGQFVDGRPLPARRVGFFLSNHWQHAHLLTDEGWRLFDAAVSWSVGRE